MGGRARRGRMSKITYRQGGDLTLDDVIRVYRASRLGERRPVGHRAIMQAMLDHADVIVTAWDGDRLVGLARTLTDFSYVAYLADLAVDLDYQRQGIGRRLIEETRSALEPSCFITLLSAPDANEYYPRIGFGHNPRAWMLPAEKPVPLG